MTSMFSDSRRNGIILFCGILSLCLVHSPDLSLGEESKLFDRPSGRAIKCYILTKETVRYSDRIGFDPETGKLCREVTPELVERLRAYEAGKRPTRITEDDASKITFFDLRTGEPNVWYSKRADGAVVIFDLMGFDPETGDELLPIDKDTVQAWRVQSERSKPVIDEAPPKRIDDLLKVEAPFEPVTGKPNIWYWKSPTGSYEFFDKRGFYPGTGDRLLPVTKAFIEEWKRHIASQTRKPPGRVAANDLTKIMFFDPLTGEPAVWYWKSPTGSYELFDNEGYHPVTGDRLLPITKDVVADLARSNAPPEPKCYVITHEGVRYGDKPGIDPVTGKQCREIKPEILERLREYEKGKRPTPITEDVNKITFFDPRTGEPIVWYSRALEDTFELFDLMGFHPKTGEELTPVTKEVVEQILKGAIAPAPPPKRVENPQEDDFFDSSTGKSKLWYWKSPTGSYEFFDNKGYHPGTGDFLAPATRQVVDEWKASKKCYVMTQRGILYGDKTGGELP